MLRNLIILSKERKVKSEEGKVKNEEFNGFTLHNVQSSMFKVQC